MRLADLEDPHILMEVNNSAIPDVNRLDDQKARWLLDHAILARMATVDGRVAGVMVVFGETAELDSEYYRWFTARYRNFIYVDRIIVPAWARRCGVGTKLYREVDRCAVDKGVAVASEVYCDPPNTASLAFHRRLEYAEVGRQTSRTEAKTVAKLMKYVENAQRTDR
jgi:predicted GNAT superfamily acetyltransferase